MHLPVALREVVQRIGREKEKESYLHPHSRCSHESKSGPSKEEEEEEGGGRREGNEAEIDRPFLSTVSAAREPRECIWPRVAAEESDLLSPLRRGGCRCRGV